ncbi:MAG: glycogen debranching protein GlgX [Cyanobacteria bacterium]|nr:glycogen debranching protein GlgX [Cyanobacteriota bacterium]
MVSRMPIWHDSLFGYKVQRNPDSSFLEEVSTKPLVASLVPDNQSSPEKSPETPLEAPLVKAERRQSERSTALYTPPDFKLDVRDSAAYAPLAIVIDPAFTWGDDKAPRTPWHKTLIYETHVKGLTYQHPDIPENIRGTYAGIASEPMINYFKDLGVTAIELMPIHTHLDDQFLVNKNLSNYWGYNSLCFFSPDACYASQPHDPFSVLREFKMMVRTLHSAGLEVILDVVFNHTAEGNQMGPTLSFRGIDNRSYYRLVDGQAQYYMDYTGCGNTINIAHPRILQLVMDSLRYWIEEMHIDGFRFDLATALARELHAADKLSSFFDIIHQDPVISQVKLIAEPWDLGEGGYQVGNFPVLWTEWNGRYRDTVRHFWRGDNGCLSDFATRFSGSSDLYAHSGRKPHASINFVTAHDGFTMADLVSYNDKHNQANGEDNRDGENHNISDNCGAEGPTDDTEILRRREKRRRNLMATLLLSLGVPMISGGDEMGRTQHGNNNAYCQDNPLSWYDWSPSQSDQDFYQFVRRMIRLRKHQPVLQRRRFYTGKSKRGAEFKDIYWFTPFGRDMEMEDWQNPLLKTVGILLEGSAIAEMDEQGHAIKGETLLILINADCHPVTFQLPYHRTQNTWEHLEDTSQTISWSTWEPGASYLLQENSLVLFKLHTIPAT